MSEITDKIKSGLKFTGIVALIIVGLIAASFITPRIKDYFNPIPIDTTQRQLDSLKTDILLERQARQALELDFQASQKNIVRQDSIINQNHKTVTNEIKTLHAADNRIKLAIGDSILRAREKGLH